MTPGRRLRARAAIAAVAAAAAVVFVLPATASATQTITSEGPLTSIMTTDDLNCAVNHVGDSAGEFYGNTACGTFVATNDSLYGPRSVPAGPSPTPWSEVAQTPVTGTGTSADPYTITTDVDNTYGESQPTLALSQTDSYVVGDEQYRTDVTIKNVSDTEQTGVLYRAGDCYLQNSDSGVGQQFPGGAIACRALPGSENPNRIEEWVPLTEGSSFYEAFYGQVWDAVVSQQPFDDTCRCGDEIDNGAGLSWTFDIPAGGTATFSHLTVFSPTGNQLTLSETADQSTAAAGGPDGYTITVANPNPGSATLTSLVDHLPAGFSYDGGSTSGLTSADPTIAGQDLTWSGSTVIAGGTSVTLHFNVHVSSVAGTYLTSTDGTASGSTNVQATGDTAPVTVTVPVVTPPAITGVPTITPAPQVGTLLTCNTGSWSGNPSFTFVWQRNGQPIAGATAQTYTTTANDAGLFLTCMVTATNPAGSASATSAPVQVPPIIDAVPVTTTLEPGPNHTFRIQVIYTLRTPCAQPCRAHADLRTRSGPRTYARALPGDGTLLGSRSGLVIPAGKQIRFYITIDKATLMKAPFHTEGGYRVAETRLRVYLHTSHGTVTTIHDGHIKVSIARIKSGNLPGLNGIL
jgi:uncharacterized repeat protein (TIGR01451 family)